MFQSSVMLKTLVVCLVLASLTSAVMAQAGKAPEAEIQAAFGKPFPTGQYGNLNVQAGGPATIDLAQSLGKKPVILLYWIAGNARADAMLQEVQALVAELGGDKVAFYGVAYPQEGRGADLIAERLKKLDISVPVLDDEGFGLGRMLRVQSVPNVTIVDSGGALRLTNGASLLQVLEYNMTLESAIRRVAEKGSLGTYGFLTRYYPVKELLGKKCPDFEAPLLANDTVQSWHSMIKSDRLNVLVFWSVDCPHCRTWLPEIDTWFKEHPGQANIFGAVKVTTEATKTKTEEYCAEKRFSIPMLVDQNMRISRLYQVTSTPTILIIGPDGIIETVLLSSAQDFVKTMEEKRRELIKSAG